MKKYYLYFAAAAALVLFVSCNKETEIVEENDNAGVLTYIKASAQDIDSKASISDSDASFTWNTGDQIAVYAAGYQISEGLNSAYNNTNDATFGITMDNEQRTDFAIFPASLVWNGSAIRPNSATNHTSSALTLTLPDRYTLAQVRGEVSPTPMIATNAPGGDLSFKHLCPLLRITLNNLPGNTSSVTFDFNGHDVHGEYTLTSVDPGTISTYIAGTSSSSDNDVITVTDFSLSGWTDGVVINLPVPVPFGGSYGNITVTAYDSEAHVLLTMTRPIKVSTAWAPSRNSARKIAASLPAFSVSNSSRVAIAASNLYYDGVSTFSFDTYPYTWYATGTRTGGAGDKCVWSDQHSVAPTVGNLDGTPRVFTLNGYNWRSWSKDEFNYIASTRSGLKWAFVYLSASGGFPGIEAIGNTGGVPGMFLFPDNWSSMTGLLGANMVQNGGSLNSSANNVTKDEYDRLIAAGASFLPAAGAVIGSGFNYTDWPSIAGQYWVTTVIPNGVGEPSGDGWGFQIKSSSIDYPGGWSQGGGRPIRLVREVGL